MTCWRKNIYSEKLAENLMTFQGRDSRDKHKISRVPWRIGAHTKKIACIRTEILSILLYIASHSPFFKHTFTLTADYHARGLVCPSGAIWGSCTRTLWHTDRKRLNHQPCDRWTTCSASWATAAQRRHDSHDPLKHKGCIFWFHL